MPKAAEEFINPIAAHIIDATKQWPYDTEEIQLAPPRISDLNLKTARTEFKILGNRPNDLDGLLTNCSGCLEASD